MALDEHILAAVEASLERCGANPAFLDRFYDIFTTSSPKVAEKFARTNFYRQKKALQASLHTMLSYSRDEMGLADEYLRGIADRHGRKDLGIGAELYDLWLDSLMATVREVDPEWTPELEAAWEQAMMAGIKYFLSRY